MGSRSYFPSYYSVDDIFVTQEKISCQVSSRLLKMGQSALAGATINILTNCLLNCRLPRPGM